MLENDPLWYKDAVIYQLHVKAFHDAAGDGVGDFRGLTEKLDYIQDLGVTTVWLLPFYPSPLRDDGYDIADYTDVHPNYGKVQDFQDFLLEAHRRGLRVITELVLNHTSDQHPWFQRARRSPPGSPERDFYVWSDTPTRYPEARIIFKDFEHSNWTWDHVAKAYFWHRFYSHQPDLNFDNPAVWEAIYPVLGFWLEMGVDGMRLDALPYLYEREGTNCENLPETHQYIKALRKHMDENFPNRMFLAEANQWPEDAVAYFGDGDECNMAFHFPVMPRLYMAIHMEDRYPILDILQQTPAIPENCQWAMFLRNHDELTLEMVTDEERDYMYRAYATDTRARINLGIRRRLAPLLGNNRRRIELMNALLFSMPGTPIVYYGDEIGMGDNIYLGDRDGVRTPMQWSADRNAGFSRANPQRLYLPVIIDPEYHFESINVEAQQNNPNSLLWWMKRVIALRKRYKAFGRGSIEFLHPTNRKVLAFVRRYQDEAILVVANLSRFVQYVELDLGEFQGMKPVEMFGRNPFPPVGDRPYVLTLGPHAFYWFALEPSVAAQLRLEAQEEARAVPALTVPETWEQLFQAPAKAALQEALPAFLVRRPWFHGAGREVKAARLRDTFRSKYAEAPTIICLFDIEFHEGSHEAYLLPISFAADDYAAQVTERAPAAVLARVQGGQDGLLFDALNDPRFAAALLENMIAQRRRPVGQGELVATAFAPLQSPSGADLTSVVISKEEQSSTSVAVGQDVVLKIYRRVEEGINPDLELGRYFATSTPFTAYAPLVGAIEYRPRRGEPVTLAVLHRFVPHETNAWQYTLDELSRYFERVLTLPAEQLIPGETGAPLELVTQDIPPLLQELIGRPLESAQQIGQLTADMHLGLTQNHDNPAFAPELFTTLYQRSVYQSLRNRRRRVFDELRARLPELPEEDQPLAQSVLSREEEVLHRFRTMLTRKFATLRTRYHGDYHLGQLLFTGKDFIITDFEGNPGRTIADRRIKRSALRDVASMVRSFHYVVWNAILGKESRRGQSPGVIRPEDVGVLERWGRLWYLWVSAAFLRAYLERVGPGSFLPQDPEELYVLFDIFLLEKAVAELGQELRYRPDWAAIPLRGVLELLNEPATPNRAEKEAGPTGG